MCVQEHGAHFLVFLLWGGRGGGREDLSREEIMEFHVPTYNKTQTVTSFRPIYSVCRLTEHAHLQLKQEALGSIPDGCHGFFLFQLAYTNADEMKDLWYPSTVWLLSTQT